MSVDLKSGLIPMAALATFAGVYVLTPDPREAAPQSFVSTEPITVEAQSAPDPASTAQPVARKPSRPKAVEYTYREQLAATNDAPQFPEVDTSRERSVYFSGCNEVRAAGLAPLYRGDPGYREGMDGDNDGVACEPYRGR